MSEELNMDVWLNALQDAMAQGGTTEGKTVRELSAATGITDRKVRVLIGKLMGQGRVKCIKTNATTIDGRLTTVPAYIIVDKKEVM